MSTRRQKQLERKYASLRRYTASEDVNHLTHSSRSTYHSEQMSATSTSATTQGQGAATTQAAASATGSDSRSYSVFIAIQDYEPEPGDVEGIELDQGQIVEVLDNKNVSSWLVRTKARPPLTGWVPGSYFETPSNYYKQRKTTRELSADSARLNEQQEARLKLDQVYHDLLRSEEEFVGELQSAVENYVLAFEDQLVPLEVQAKKAELTQNLKELYNLHANVMLKGLQYYSDDPAKVGETFIRLERDFDHHVRFARELPNLSQLIDEDEEVGVFLQSISDAVEEEAKTYQDYLNLIVERVKQYEEFFKEFIKYGTRAQCNTKIMQKALELIQSIPKRVDEVEFTKNIVDYPGNINRLGKLYRHDLFQVWEDDEAAIDRYVFLFRNKMMVTRRDTRRDPSIYRHHLTIRLDKYTVRKHTTDEDALVFRPNEEGLPVFRIRAQDFQAREYVRKAWLKDITEMQEAIAALDAGDDTITLSECYIPERAAPAPTTTGQPKSALSESVYSTSSRKSASQPGPEEGPPRKKIKSPPVISPTGSSTSIYSAGSTSIDWATTGTALEMQGTRVTRTQYGFRTLQESSAKMCLKVTGYPLPDISWYKDDVLVKEDERHTFYADDDGFFALTIDPVQVEDTGRYTCVATNEYGQASTSAFFRVLKVEKEAAPPKFTVSLKDQDCKEGDVVDFECEVDGWPEPELVWLVDDQPLRPTHDFRLQCNARQLDIRLNLQAGDLIVQSSDDGQKAKLEIRDAQPEDSGTYSVKITNDYGALECNAKLNVEPDPDKSHVAPEFQAVIEDVECNEGDTVKFKAVMTGDPNPEVIWYVNGVPLTESEKIKMISEDGICLLTIHDVSRHFDGIVTCQGKNRLGTASCDARLRVRIPPVAPQFTRPLEDRIVTEHSAVMFEVDVVGYPEPLVAFYLRGKPLEHGVDGVMVEHQDGHYKITIQDCQIDKHDGEILARATNEHGQAESRARLTVEPEEEESRSAPTFIKDLEDVTVKFGQEAVFETVVRGSPNPTVLWFINGQKLETDSEGVMQIVANKNEHKLVLDSTHHAGTLLARAENSIGRFETKARLIVLPAEKKKKAPEFKQPLVDKVEAEGSTAVFEVNADAEPQAQFKWFLNGEELSESSRVHIRDFDGSAKLEIHDVKLSETGQLRCMAFNTEGEASTEAKFTVTAKESPPHFDEKPKNAAVERGQEAVFEALASGVPEPSYQWSIDGRRVSTGTNGVSVEQNPDTRASILRIQTSVFGGEGGSTVVVTAQNKLGSDECGALLTVNDNHKLEVEKGLKDQTVRKGEEARFETRIKNAKPEQIKWSIAGKPIYPQSPGISLTQTQLFDFALTVDSAQYAGTIACFAEGESGDQVETKAELVVSIPKPVFQKKLQNVIEVQEGQSIEAEVIAPEATSIKWYRNGERIREMPPGLKIAEELEQGAGRSTLHIDKAGPEHAGQLSAVAENEAGSAETSGELRVNPGDVPASFTKEPTDHDVTEDADSVKFSATVTGQPTPNVRWFYRSQEIESSNQKIRMKYDRDTGKTSIRIFSAKIDESGEVRVRTDNRAGSVEASAQLKVGKRLELPRFLTEMDDRQVNEGANIKFTVRVEGHPEPEVQWTLNGEQIADDNVHASSSGDTHTLEFDNVRPKQSGEISCLAKNSVGLKKQNAQLLVKETGEAPVFTRQLEDRLAEEKETIVMEAQLKIGAKPKPSIEWLRDGKPLRSGDHFTLSEEAENVLRLTITSAELEDKSRITVRAENTFGSAESSASIAVQKRRPQTKPAFLSGIDPITITEGDSLHVKLLVSGDPEPYAKWYINQQMVYATEDTEMKNEAGVYSLTIHGCTKDMTGKIKCTVGNKMGEATTEGKLTVIAPVPVEFEQSLCDATCREGDTLKLKAVLLGEPMPDVTWYVNGKKLEESQKIKIHAEKGTYTVTIRDITLDYSGKVVCEAINEFGKASSEATLKVLPRGEPPDFLEWLSNIRARQGATIQHKVVYTGDPRPVITWFINGHEVKSSDELTIITDESVSTLTIRSFNPDEHVGEIICKAENDAGEVSCTANMATYTSDMTSESSQNGEGDEETHRTPTPVMAPAFITKIRDTKVKRGHQAIFECVVPDTKGVCCKWLKDGNEIELIARIRVQTRSIEGHMCSELIIDETEPEDAGKYTVIVENPAGTDQCQANLTVVDVLEKPAQRSPEFVVKLQDRSTQPTERVTFECKVAAEPDAKITWLKDDEKLAEEPKKIRIESEPDGTQRLTIENADMPDEGKYSCVAENDLGKAKTEAALTVESKEPQFTRPLDDQKVALGEQIVLECSVSGAPQPSVEFYTAHDDFKLNTGTRLSIQHDATNSHWRMVIKNATETDYREYAAVAKNTAGVAKCTCRVEKRESEEKPRIIEGLKKTRVKEGETAEMSVRVAGKPLPDLEWYKNGEPIRQDGQRIQFVEYRNSGEYKLVIRDASAEDQSQYAVVASNPAGTDTSKAPLIVDKNLRPPEFIERLVDTTVKESEQCCFFATVVGVPKPSVQWLKDGVEISVSSHQRYTAGVLEKGSGEGAAIEHTLTIADANEAEDAGSYCCRAVNEAGQAETAVKLIVVEDVEAPHFIDTLQPMEVREGEPSAALSVRVAGKPEPRVEWFKDGRPVEVVESQHSAVKDEGGGRHSLELKDVRGDDAGIYSCKATNKAGRDETLAKFAVIEDLEAPRFTRALDNEFEVREGTTVRLECTVEGKPEPCVEWLRDGRPVNIDNSHIVAKPGSEKGQHTLVINNARMSDAGTYSCKAVNKAGQAETASELFFPKYGEEKVEEEHAAPLDTTTTRQAPATGEAGQQPGPPEFIELLKSATTTIGGEAVLKCRVKGYPRPTITWSKHSQSIVESARLKLQYHEDGTIRLTIPVAELNDGGEYRCEAENEYGSAWTEGPIIIATEGQVPIDGEAPDFSQPVRPVTVIEGETAVLEGEVTGTPRPDIKWYKGNELITPESDERYTIENLPSGTQRLTVRDAKMDDMDDYRCEASNKYGDVWSDVTLTVQLPATVEEGAGFGMAAPTFVKALEECIIEEGETAEFECIVEGEPKPDIKWFKDSKEIDANNAHFKQTTRPDGTTRLSIPAAQMVDGGSFRCEATNSAGMAQSEAPLKVCEYEPTQVAPEFLQELKPAKANEGERAAFECKVTGTPAPEVKWMRDGEELKDGDGVHIEARPDGTHLLIIDHAKLDDQGTYRVDVSNDAGSISSKAPLTVVAPPKFTKGLEDQSLSKGTKLVLEVQVADESPTQVKYPSSLWWLKDGAPVDVVKCKLAALGDGRFSLTIPEVGDEDFGLYTVKVSNDAGEAESSGRITEAEQKPEIISGLKPAAVKEGATAKFEVQTKGPVRDVKWYKNGREMDDAQTEQPDATHYRLIIPNAQKGDEAEYRVVLSNSAGEASSSAPLTVKKPIAFTQPLEDQSVKKGAAAKLVVETNIPPKEIKWYKNGKELQPGEKAQPKKLGDSKFELDIPETNFDDAAQYTVRVADENGDTAKSSCALTVLLPAEPPKIVKGLVDQIVAEGDELTFEIKVEGDVQKVQWLKDGEPAERAIANAKIEQVDGDTYRLTVPRAAIADAGEFEVRAINDAGQAASSAHAEVDQSPKIVKGLVPAEIEVGDEHVFRVEVSAPVRDVKWYKNGVEVHPGPNLSLKDVSPKKYELIINEAQLEDGATYKVVLANKAGSCDSEAQLTVTKPEVLKLLDGLKDVEVEEGQPLELKCRIEGRPASVKWYKNGNEVVDDKDARIQLRANPNSGDYSLYIPEANQGDAAAYRVVFTSNKGGDLQSAANAYVKAKKPEVKATPANFLSPLEDVTVQEGETITLKCQMGGEPQPQLKWYRNGVEVKPDDRVAIRLALDGTATLRIRDSKKSDAGEFHVEAVNEAGSAESRCQVKVLSEEDMPCAPKFIIPLKRTEGIPGEPCVFKVKVKGVPTPKLTWFLNGQPVDEGDDRMLLEDLSDGNYSLTIKDVRESDFGTIKCLAKNENGQDECEAALEPDADWLAKKKQAEGYPPKFNVPLHDRRLPSGHPMSVECHVDAKPSAEVEWFKDGAPLAERDGLEIRNTPDGTCRLKIEQFQEGDVGEYKCQAKNVHGTADTSARLTLEPKREEEAELAKGKPPKFNPGLEDVHLNDKEPLQLFCHIDATPAATVSWYKDGVPLKSDNERIQLEYDEATGDCYLSLDEVADSDAGAYRCVAANALGSTNTACNVTVKGKKEEVKKEGAEPFFTKGLVDQWVDRGETLTFHCEVTGDPDPEIKWYRNGVLLKPSNKISIEKTPGGECKLVVKDCTMNDEGVYRCEAENPLGKAKTQASAHVEMNLSKVEKLKEKEGAPPRFIIPLEDRAVLLGSSIALECKVTGEPMPAVKWSKDGNPLREDSRFSWDNDVAAGAYSLRIRDATLNDEGTYRCVATNESGSATTKSLVRIDDGNAAAAKPAGISNAPRITARLQDVRVQEGQPLKLYCKIEGDPLPEITWFKDGEKVAPSDRLVLEQDPDGSARLIIPSCTLNDDGIYRVIATNPHGSANDKCTATVRKAPLAAGTGGPDTDFDANKTPRVLVPLENVRVPEKERFKLTCRFGPPEPKLTIKWFKDGDRVYAYDNLKLEELPDGTCELTVLSAKKSDAGSYRCLAENAFGQTRTSGEVTVVAKEKKPVNIEDQQKEGGLAPGFKIPLTTKRAKPGEQVVFECLPYGNPFPEIKWLKDGMELTPQDDVKMEALPDGTQRLILDNVDSLAEGNYRCVASNPHGTASTKAELKVKQLEDRYPKAEEMGEPEQSKPRIRRGLYPQSIHEGSSVEMVVCATGWPTPTVKWFKDGVPLESEGPDGRLVIFTDDRGVHHLVIVNVQPSDEGEYSLTATNPLGEASTSGTLGVIRPRGRVEGSGDGRGGMPFPPGFIRQLKNKHVFTHMPTIYDCLVVGYPPPDVEWFHNGKKIIPDERIMIQSCAGGSHALLIKDTCLEDAGEYVAIAKNAHGSAQSSAILDVSTPHMDNIKFDGSMPDVTPYITEEYGFSKLKFLSLPTPPDRGPFIKEVTGHYLTLSWIPSKRTPPRYPQITYVVEYRELPYKEWTLLDYNIPEPVCKVRNLDLGKSYQFRVRAENIYGISDPSPASPPSRLMAPPPPVLDRYKRVIPLLDPYGYGEKAIDEAYGEKYACSPWFAPGVVDKRYCAEKDTFSITLHCSGYPEPKIDWKFRGWDVDTKSPTSNYRVSTMRGGSETNLTIMSFSKENAGQYQCVATNQYGTAQQNILIEVATRPAFIQPLSDRNITSDRGTLRLDVRVEGAPAPEVKWFRDWRPLVESSRCKFADEGPYLRTLLINDPIWRDSGVYSCIAVNDAGQAATSCMVNVEDLDLTQPQPRPERRKVALEAKKIREIYEIEEQDEKCESYTSEKPLP